MMQYGSFDPWKGVLAPVGNEGRTGVYAFFLPGNCRFVSFDDPLILIPRLFSRVKGMFNYEKSSQRKIYSLYSIHVWPQSPERVVPYDTTGLSCPTECGSGCWVNEDQPEGPLVAKVATQ